MELKEKDSIGIQVVLTGISFSRIIGSKAIGVITTIIDFQYKLKKRMNRFPHDNFRTGNVILIKPES